MENTFGCPSHIEVRATEELTRNWNGIWIRIPAQDVGCGQVGWPVWVALASEAHPNVLPHPESLVRDRSLEPFLPTRPWVLRCHPAPLSALTLLA